MFAALHTAFGDQGWIMDQANGASTFTREASSGWKPGKKPLNI